MRFRFWTYSVKSNVLINYLDAFSVIDLSTNKLLSKNDELSFSENEIVFLLAKGFDAGKESCAPIIVEAVVDYLKDSQIEKNDSLLEKAFLFVNRTVRETYENVYGADVVGLHFKNNAVSISHVGKNRAYLIRDGILGQITKDQTLYDQNLENGVVEPKIWEKYGGSDFWGKRVTLQAVCGNAELFPEVLRLELLDGDKLILATEGIWCHTADKNRGLAYYDEVIMNGLFSKVLNETSGEKRNTIIKDFLDNKTVYEDASIIIIEVKNS